MERCIVITGMYCHAFPVLTGHETDPNYCSLSSRGPLTTAFPTGCLFAFGAEELLTEQNLNTHASAEYTESTLTAYAGIHMRST